ncbi:MAG: LytTR family DNA-binding domain-containing protein [Acidobacteriota bacterium]
MIASPLRALVVDDEPAARRLLTTLLDRQPDIEVAGTCSHSDEAIDWLAADTVDLLFLDIEMPGRDGFELLDALDTPPQAVVFVTAHDAFAIRAFEAEAWDYLLKPFDDERLSHTLDRVRRRLAGSTAETATEPDQPPLERLTVPHARGRVQVRLADVAYFQAESKYVRFHLADTSYLARVSLTYLESRLDRRRFVRVHRSAIVNTERIARLEPLGHGDLLLVLDDDRKLTLSRRYRERLERVLEPLP